jgi:hypothetical protein
MRESPGSGSYRAVLDYNPHFALASFHLAQLLKELDRPEEAKAALQTFLSEWKDADPDVPEKTAALRLEEEL